jgi:hypothetical protein
MSCQNRHRTIAVGRVSVGFLDSPIRSGCRVDKRHRHPGVSAVSPRNRAKPHAPVARPHHSLNQVMTQCEAARNSASPGREAHLTVTQHPHQAILLEPSQSHADGRRRHRQPMCQRGRNYTLTFAFRFEDSLQVVFFRNSDHLRQLYVGS